MERLLNESNFTENTSTYSDKKDKDRKSKQDNQSNINSNNYYSNLIENLTNDKSDTDKIKALILLEQDVLKIKDKNKYKVK